MYEFVLQMVFSAYISDHGYDFMEINTQQSLAYTIVLPDLILGFLSCVSNYEYHVTTTQHSGPKQIDHRTSINRRACQMDTRFYRRGLA